MDSYCDLGSTLISDFMISFQNTIYVLIILMLYIIIGNTGFPILLRLIIWILFKSFPGLSSLGESIVFLLGHP